MIAVCDVLTSETIAKWRLHKKGWRVNQAVQDPREMITIVNEY